MDAIELSSKLIEFDSVTPHTGPVIGYIASLLESAGFECHVLEFNGVSNLYAKFGGEGKAIAFSGHVDVVPAGDLANWDSDPYTPTIKDGRLYGRGASDMKAGIASMIVASLNYINKNSGEINGSISFIITGDEETSSEDGMIPTLNWMQENNIKVDDVIVGEPTTPGAVGEMIKIGRRGSYNNELTVKGKQGHVAYPHLASNPITTLVQILNELKSTPLDNGNEYFPKSNLEITSLDAVNPVTNLIISSAKAGFNIRFNNIHDKASLDDFINNICQKYSSDYELKNISYTAPFLTEKAEISDILTKSITDVTGLNTVLSTTGGTSDARFIFKYANVVECGLSNETAHKSNENVLVEDIIKLTSIYERVLDLYFDFA